MAINENETGTGAGGTTVIHLRTKCGVKSPALRKAMHQLVGNITAGVAQVVAQEVSSFLEALEQTVEERTVGGASHE
jgi:hypothetical protein